MKYLSIFIFIIILISCSNPNDLNSEDFDNEVEFTIDGGGFNKVKYKFNSYKDSRMNWARYDSSTGITHFNITNAEEEYLSQSNFSLSFKGKEPGYYSIDYLNNRISINLHINKDSVFQAWSKNSTSSDGITIDEYSEIGGDIIGAFSCEISDIVRYDFKEIIKVEGKFKVLRLEPLY